MYLSTSSRGSGNQSVAQLYRWPVYCVRTCWKPETSIRMDAIHNKRRPHKPLQLQNRKVTHTPTNKNSRAVCCVATLEAAELHGKHGSEATMDGQRGRCRARRRRPNLLGASQRREGSRRGGWMGCTVKKGASRAGNQNASAAGQGAWCARLYCASRWWFQMPRLYKLHLCVDRDGNCKRSLL